MQLRDLYFAHDEMFVVPVEELGDAGMSDRFAQALHDERGLGADWVALFDAAVQSYTARVADLFARAPASWFPPRLQNICVVTDAARTRPYYEPFAGSSWLVYASDFDPERSNVEYATYALAHVERFGREQSMGRAVGLNLGWWIGRSDAELSAFAEASRHATRPDAEAFVALAEATPWIRDFYHADLRPPQREPAEPHVPLSGLRLYVPRARAEQLRTLVKTFDEVATGVARSYYAAIEVAPASSEAFEDLTHWLQTSVPSVRVADVDGAVLWDPSQPQSHARLCDALDGVAPACIDSLRADLAVVSDRTQRFLSAVEDPATLPDHADEVDPEGGTYIDATRQLVVYMLEQPGLDPRKEPAPPFHRLLLGARTTHEWGHLAVDAGWVGVAETDALDHAAARAQVASAYERLLANASEPMREAAHDDLRELGIPVGRFSVALTDLTLSRVSDYLANLLMRELSPRPETEAYVRANVKTHVHEPLPPLRQIARYAYEFQYLRLSAMDDPVGYFVHSTWFPDFFLRPGLVREADFVGLLDAVGRVCATYRIDRARIDPQR